MHQYSRFGGKLSQWTVLFLFGVFLLMTIIFVSSCSGEEDPISESPKASSLGVVPNFSGKSDGFYYDVLDSQIAEIMSYKLEDGHLYLANVMVLDEFGVRNEGSVDLNNGVLRFGMIRATGSVTGAVDGPKVTFEVHTETNEVQRKSFEPAPDYRAFGIEKFEKYSNKTIELDDERILEIAEYFAKVLQRFEELSPNQNF